MWPHVTNPQWFHVDIMSPDHMTKALCSIHQQQSHSTVSSQLSSATTASKFDKRSRFFLNQHWNSQVRFFLNGMIWGMFTSKISLK